MITRAVFIATLLAWSSNGLAQVAVGDSLWQRGHIAEATAAYQRAMEADRYSVRANVLVARALAWGSNFDSALVLLRNARVRVPDDPDVRYSEGLYLSWAKRFDAAILRFDSLLATNPELDYVRVARARTMSWAGRFSDAEAAYRAILSRVPLDADAARDAGIGLAQVTSWRGDLPGAAARYTALMADDPSDTRVLVGLASVRTWQGRPRAAASLLERVVQGDSANLEARTMLASARAAAKPTSEVEIDWSDDSDGDHNAWLLVTQRTFLSEGLSLSTNLGSLEAHDAVRNASRALGEATLTATGDRARLSASLGARALDPATPGVPSRSTITARAAATVRLPGSSTAGVSVARLPFDEIASLIARSLDLTSVDATLDLAPLRGLKVGLAGGLLSLSDGNHRTMETVRVSQHWTGRPWIGALARTMSFDQKGVGYFSPSRFTIYEAQGGWEREEGEWTGSLDGGLGLQQVDPSKPWQNAYHTEAQIAHRWTNGNSVAFSAGISTSAAASAVGAFRYRTAGLSAKLAW
jgi:tetratricopeptide (TPR) repeat protein